MHQEAQNEYNDLMLQLQSMHTAQEEDEGDKATWKWSKEGAYSVKTCYRALEEGPYIESVLNKI